MVLRFLIRVTYKKTIILRSFTVLYLIKKAPVTYGGLLLTVTTINLYYINVFVSLYHKCFYIETPYKTIKHSFSLTTNRVVYFQIGVAVNSSTVNPKLCYNASLRMTSSTSYMQPSSSATKFSMNLFCGSTWTRTKIDGLTVRSNRPLYDRPVC